MKIPLTYNDLTGRGNPRGVRKLISEMHNLMVDFQPEANEELVNIMDGLEALKKKCLGEIMTNKHTNPMYNQNNGA